MTKLPKNARIGEKHTRTVSVKGRKRNITFKKVSPHGKNKNLNWKIVKNQKA